MGLVRRLQGFRQGSSFTRIRPQEAKQLGEKILREQRKNRNLSYSLPKIDKHFLGRWKQRYRVVFRKPNRRYKCSRVVLKTRLKAMWSNNIRVRQLAKRTLGIDLADKIIGIDEKPLMMNESGSKNIGTLEIEGEICALKECHAATRKRCTEMTMCTSNKILASHGIVHGLGLWLEIMVKAKTDFRARQLRKLIPEGRRISVTFGVKGSYREEHLLRYLKRVLPVWTEARAAVNDYWLLYNDVAKSHLGTAPEELAWERGFVLMFHYGSTTAVAQVNDTDIHGPFEKDYQDREQECFNRKAEIIAGDISRTEEELLEDSTAVWLELDHHKGVRGHKYNGLSVSLETDPAKNEDDLIAREAKFFWDEIGMAAERDAIIAEVNAKVDSGEWVWADLRNPEKNIIRHPENPGVQVYEGEEFEGLLQPGEKPFFEGGENDEDPIIIDDEEEFKSFLFPGKGDLASASSEASAALQTLDVASKLEKEIAALPGEDETAILEAKTLAKKMDDLKRLRKFARDIKTPSIARLAESELSKQRRSLRNHKPGKQAESALILRRAMNQEARKQQELFQKRRENAHVAKKAAAFARLTALKLKQKKEAEAKLKKAEEMKKIEKMKSLPMTVDPKSCGQLKEKGGGKAELDMRMGVLERLKYFSPPLPEALEAEWELVKHKFAVKIAKDHGKNTGNVFCQYLKDTKKALGKQYKGFVEKKAGEGDPAAFAKFVGMMKSLIPKAALEVTL